MLVEYLGQMFCGRTRARALVALLLAFVCGCLRAQTPAMLAPSGVVYDSVGNLFVADTARNQVFEIALSGAVSVVAGTGEQGFSGDGGSAIAAELNAPQGLAVAADGTLYVADAGNQRVRAVSHGTITTFAGTGVRGYTGDGSLATAARLSSPVSLAVDASGAVLICDSANHRVRRVAGGTIATVAGNGLQGFSGDGGKAIDAQLDSLAGVAVMSDGRIIIADSHNHRLRIVGLDGSIQTFAGTGTRGFSGDGGAATSANLMLPRGVAITGAGDVMFADSDNQRIRAINAQGIISTIAGSGWQGTSNPDGQIADSSSLDTPKFVAATPNGVVTFAEPHARLVGEVAADGDLYAVASSPQPVRVSTVTLTVPSSVVYGQGSARVAVSGSAAKPQGSVVLSDAGSSLGVVTLASGAGNVSLQTLAAGNHSLLASYSGDGLNPAAQSVISSIAVQPAEVTATANPSTIIYGQSVGTLSGSSSGILSQDASSVGVSFSTIAGTLANVGTYPITATLSGAGAANYKLSLGADSGSLAVIPASSSLTLQVPTQAGYAGLPIMLSAYLKPAFGGTPSGKVIFRDGGTEIARTTTVGGVASATYLAPAAGDHVITATYAGDGNFLANSSTPLSISVAAIPDFTLAAGSSTQTVQAGLIATYLLSVAPQGGPFTGSVSFSISGLPSGVEATFSPALVVPGSSGASVTLSLQTPKALAEDRAPHSRTPIWFACVTAGFVLVRFRRKRALELLSVVCVSFAALSIAGCGMRTVSTGTQTTRSFPLTVTATSTNLASKVVTHAASVTLVIQ